MITRIRKWWNSLPSETDRLENKVIIPQARWDGFPETPEECRRSFTVPNKRNYLNVHCPSCGGQILRHKVDEQ